MSTQQKDIPPNKPKKDTFQTIWKSINIILLAVQLYCIPGFISFRQIALEKNISFVRTQGWLCALAASIIYGAVKYGFFAIFQSTAYAIVHPKYTANEGQRNYRAQAILKHSFDLIFYSCSSIICFCLFRQKHWFPKQLGGLGEHSEIFRDYPEWPKDTDNFTIQTYYMIQLGVYAFKIVESFAIRRKTYRKVYQFLLHHFVAETLIVFSLLSNLLPIGVVILFLHDCCDATAYCVRIYVETKYRNTPVSVFLFLLAAGNWFYMRLYVFPFYSIKALNDAVPKPGSDLYSIWFQHFFLVILSWVLVVMHIYWWLWIMAGGINMMIGKGIFNPHDKGTTQAEEEKKKLEKSE